MEKYKLCCSIFTLIYLYIHKSFFSATFANWYYLITSVRVSIYFIIQIRISFRVKKTEIK